MSESRFNFMMELAFVVGESARQMQEAVAPLIALSKDPVEIDLRFKHNIDAVTQSLKGLQADVAEVGEKIGLKGTGGRKKVEVEVDSDALAKRIETAVAAGVKKALGSAQTAAKAPRAASVRAPQAGAEYDFVRMQAMDRALSASATTPKLGADRMRDRTSETLAAAKAVRDAHLKHEKELLRLQTAGYERQQKSSVRRLQDAEHGLRIAREELRVLTMSGEAATIHRQASSHVENAFGGGYSRARAQGFAGDFDAFVGQVQGGDQAAGRHFLNGIGVSDEQIKDQQHLNSLVAEGTEALEQSLRIWREGNREIEDRIHRMERAIELGEENARAEKAALETAKQAEKARKELAEERIRAEKEAAKQAEIAEKNRLDAVKEYARYETEMLERQRREHGYDFALMQGAARADAMSATGNSFGLGQEADPHAANLKAISNLNKEHLRYQKEIRALAALTSEEEREAAHRKLETAERALRIAREEVRVRMLEPGWAQAHGRATRGVQEHFMGAFARARQSGFSGDFDGFVEGVQGGNRRLAEHYLRARGVQVDLIRGERELQVHLERHLGPLRGQIDLWQQGNREVAEQVQNLQRAEQEARRLKESLRSGPGAGGAGEAEPGAFGPKGNTQMGKFLRGLQYRIGGWGLGMMAAFALRDAFRQNVNFESEMAQMQGIIGSQGANQRPMLERGVRDTAKKYGANLVEATQATKLFAQAGFNAADSIQQLDLTMMAMRGLGMTIEQAQELAIVIRSIRGEATGLNDTLDILSKIGAVEAKFAVTSRDLADSITVVSPVVQQFMRDVHGLGDSFDYTIGMTTVLVERLRITGREAGNALKFILSRMLQPHILKSLQGDFGLRLAKGGKEGGDFLELPDLLQTISKRYVALANSANGAERAMAKQLAVVVAGGRRVNAVIPLLEEWGKAQDIMTLSATGFGDAQRRTAVAMDTLSARLSQLKISWESFVGSIMNTSGVFSVLNSGVSGVSAILAGPSGQGGGMYSMGGLALGAIGVGRGAKWAAGGIERAASGAAATSRLGQMFSGTRGALGAVGGLLGPTGTLIASFLALSAAVDWARWIFEQFSEDKEKLSSGMSQEDILASPQFQRYAQLAERLGVTGGADELAVSTENALLGYSGVLDKALAKYGLNDIDELLKELEKDPGTKRFEGLRREIGVNLVDALGGSIEKLRELQGEQEKVAMGLDLVSLAAQNANALLAGTVNRLSEINAAARGKGLAALDGLRAPNSSGAFGFVADMADRMMATLNMRLKEDAKFYVINRDGKMPIKTLGIYADTFFQDIFGKNAIARTASMQVDNLKLKEMIQGASAAGITKKGKGSEESLTGVQAYHLMLNQITMVEDEYRDFIRSAAASRLREMEAEEAINAANRATHGTPQANNIESFEDLRVRVEKIWTDLNEEMDKQIKKLATQNQPKADRLEKAWRALMDSGLVEKSVASITGLSQAMGKFNDMLFNMLLTFDRAMTRADADSYIAHWTGQAFDSPKARAGALQTLAVGLVDFPAETQRAIAELENQVRNADQAADGEILKGQSVQSFLEKLAATSQDTSGEMLEQSLKKTFGQRATQMALQVDVLREARTKILGVKESILSAFTDPELKARIRSNLGEIEAGQVEAIGTVVEALIGSLNDQLDQSAAKDLRNQSLDLGIQRAQAIRDMQMGALPGNLDPAERVRRQREIEEQFLATNIDLLSKREGVDLRVLAIEIEQMRALHEQSEEMRAQQALLDAELALRDQVFANMEQGLSGLQSAIADLDLWGKLAKGEANFGAVAERILGPLAQTFQQRFSENLVGTIQQAMSKSELMKEIFGTPELRMKSAIGSASELGGISLGDGVVNGALRAAPILEQAITTALSRIPVPTMPRGTASIAPAGATDLDTLQPEIAIATATMRADALMQHTPQLILDRIDPKTFQRVTQVNPQTGKAVGFSPKDNLIIGAGQMLGSIGGTMAGGGGAGSQMGSTFGSTAGMALGAPGGAIGMAVGSAIGGFLGGALGGLFDSDDASESEAVHQLAAIERAQRETISAIERQTDRLIDPNNMLFNLPSTFRTPAYSPALSSGGSGPASGGATQTLVQNAQVSVSVNLPAGDYDADEIASVVEQAIANSLNGARNSSSRGADRRSR